MSGTACHGNASHLSKDGPHLNKTAAAPGRSSHAGGATNTSAASGDGRPSLSAQLDALVRDNDFLFNQHQHSCSASFSGGLNSGAQASGRVKPASSSRPSSRKSATRASMLPSARYAQSKSSLVASRSQRLAAHNLQLASHQTGATSLFSLTAPPPFDIRVDDLMSITNQTLPPLLRCAARDLHEFTLSNEACMLCTHCFWYTFCAMNQPGSELEQETLLRLMSSEMARLVLKVGNKGSKGFFDRLPFLIAIAVLSALESRSLLPPSTLLRCSLADHLVGLLSGFPTDEQLLTLHEAAATLGGGLRPASAQTRRMLLASGSCKAFSPSLACASPPPLPAMRARASAETRADHGQADSAGHPSPSAAHSPSRSREGGTSTFLTATDSAPDAASPPRSPHAHTSSPPAARGDLLALSALCGSVSTPALGRRRTRPQRVRVDLRGHTPLLQLYQQLNEKQAVHAKSDGHSALQSPQNSRPTTSTCSETRQYRASNGTLNAANTVNTSNGPAAVSASPHASAAAPLVAQPQHALRYSMPTKHSALGGVDSFRKMQPGNTMQRSAKLMEAWRDSQRKSADEQRSIGCALRADMERLDKLQAELLAKPQPLLSEHCALFAAVRTSAVSNVGEPRRAGDIGPQFKTPIS